MPSRRTVTCVESRDKGVDDSFRRSVIGRDRDDAALVSLERVRQPLTLVDAAHVDVRTADPDHQAGIPCGSFGLPVAPIRRSPVPTISSSMPSTVSTPIADSWSAKTPFEGGFYPQVVR
jgi:hypothetical protein